MSKEQGNRRKKINIKIIIASIIAIIFVICIVYNIIAILIFKNTTSIAFATILNLITWVIYSTHDLKNVTNEKKVYVYTFSLTIFFLLCAHYLNWIIGGCVYLIGYLIFTYLFNKEVLIDIKDTVKGILNKKSMKKDSTN